MISHKHKFIFIHIPKTGGNSIQNALLKFSDDEKRIGNIHDGIQDFEIYNKTYDLWKHTSLKSYYVRMPQDLFQQYTKFTCVRNPWERMISAYFYANRENPVFNKDRFLKHIKHYRPYTIMISIRKFLRKKICMDCVIRFENMQNDFDKVCDKIGIPRQKLIHLNRGNYSKHYSSYYDDETRDMVAKKCKREIEEFSYQFEYR